MNDDTIEMRPVGYVRNKDRKTSWRTNWGKLTWRQKVAQMKGQRESPSEIVLDRVPEEILEGIEEFSHLTVLYWAHLVSDEDRKTTTVHPLGSPEFPSVGVFATHSPVRPNSILLTNVRLLGRKGNVLTVNGLDALDGSPVLDIKPYAPSADELMDVKTPEWMKQVLGQFDSDSADR